MYMLGVTQYSELSNKHAASLIRFEKVFLLQMNIVCQSLRYHMSDFKYTDKINSLT